jgi:hypothetical protein
MAIVEALDAAPGGRRRPRLRSTAERSSTIRAAHPVLRCRSRARGRDEEEALRLANQTPYGARGSQPMRHRRKGERPDRPACPKRWRS